MQFAVHCGSIDGMDGLRRWPWMAAGASALIICVGVGALGARIGLERLSYLALVAALWPLLAGLFSLARQWSQAGTSSTPAQLDDAALMLGTPLPGSGLPFAADYPGP